MLSMADSAQLMQDQTFRGRVKAAVLSISSRMLGQHGSYSNAQLRWATQAFTNPEGASQVLIGPTVMEPGVQTSGGDVDDGGLIFSVENAMNKML